MSKEVQFVIPSVPSNAYFVVRGSVGNYWNASTPGFEAYNASHWSNYATALTQDGSSQQYNGNFPAAPAGVYGVIGYARVGASPATSDTFVEFQKRFEWTGLAIATLATIVSLLTAYRIRITVSVTSTAGTTAHVKVQLVDAFGAVVNIHSLDAAATCAVTVIQDGGSTQFSLSTSNFGSAATGDGWFEANYSNPSFSTDVGYTAEATVVCPTIGSTYNGSATFFVVP